MGNTKRTLAIIGASALILGFFLPLISVFGLLTFSYLDLVTKVSARFSTGIVILALGVLSLALALKNNFRPLIGTGALAFAVLLFDFVTYKSFLRGMAPMGGVSGGSGGAPAEADQFADQFLGIVIQPAFGMFLLAAGAILLVVAGAMKDKPAAPGVDWNNNPPPPMNYS
jgi:hypothetical protein